MRVCVLVHARGIVREAVSQFHTRTVASCRRSRPYASAAATGSRSSRTVSRPASLPAGAGGGYMHD